MAINTAYLARHDVDDLEYQLKTLPGRICSGQFHDKTLCILSPRYLVRLLENNVTTSFARLSMDLPYVGRRPPNRKKIGIPFGTLSRAGYSVSLLDRFAYHPHDVVMDLRQGFRLPEGELLLANSRETQIPLLLDPARPVQRIHVDLTPLNARDESGRTFSVRIGPHHAGKWTLKTRSTIAVEVPKEAWTSEFDGRQILPLVFEWDHSGSPHASGATLAAAAGFHELRLEY